MKRYAVPAVLAVILIACLAGYFVTRDTSSSRIADKVRRNPQSGLMDDRLLKTADALASLADTPEGQALAKDAIRLADHELDQAFATALREAISAPPPSTGPLKVLADQ